MTFADVGVPFAQAGGGAGGGTGGGTGGAEVFIVIFVLAYIVMLAAAIAVNILYLLTLSRVLRQCAPRNRTMEPGQVWLNLIPGFGLIWMFITVSRVSESLDDEYYDRGLRRDGDFGKNLGTTYCILIVCCFIPYVGSLAAIAALILWIMYWVKIAGYTRQLSEGDSYREERDDYRRRRRDEQLDSDRRRRDDDDRPSRRRRDEYDDREDDEDDRPSRRRRSDD